MRFIGPSRKPYAMIMSSRTPEGQPGTCPLCQADVVVEPSILFGDATCPNCGQLLSFIQFSEVARFFVPRSLQSKDRILDIIANQLGVDRDRIVNNPSLFNEIGVDSLDTVELVMAMEEEFDH